MAARENFAIKTEIKSDAAPLNKLIANVLAQCSGVRCFRDPTRGGLASTLNEFAEQSQVSIEIDEIAVPVKDEVRGYSDLLGLDIFQIANEGKMLCVVAPEQANAALEAMKASPYGKDAAIIGSVVEVGTIAKPIVYAKTSIGTKRIIDPITGELLPRIC
jgi:hydrogenase expression/formation protein HypE